MRSKSYGLLLLNTAYTIVSNRETDSWAQKVQFLDDFSYFAFSRRTLIDDVETYGRDRAKVELKLSGFGTVFTSIVFLDTSNREISL